MKNITLEKLIYKNYLKTSLASIIFIETILVLVYFLVSNNIINKNIDYILKDLQKNTTSIVNEKIDLINNKLSEMESLVNILQKEHQDFFTNKLKFSPNQDIEFSFASNGMFYKVYNNGGSSVAVSKETKIAIVYGTQDDVSTPAMNKEFYELAKKKGLNVQLVEAKNAPHMELEMTKESKEVIEKLLED